MQFTEIVKCLIKKSNGKVKMEQEHCEDTFVTFYTNKVTN